MPHGRRCAIAANAANAAEHFRNGGVDIAQLAVQFSIANPQLATCIVGTANPANVQKWVQWAALPIDQELLAEVQNILLPIHNWFYVEGRPENNDPQ